MTKTTHFCMPDGLPTFLSSGKAGFDALCTLLAIDTTRQKQGILNAPFVKQALKTLDHKVSRQSKTAERIRKGLTALYSDPSTRRALWRAFNSRGEETTNPSISPIPSIEYEALKRYDENLVSAEIDPKDLEKSSEFYAPEAVADDWRGAAVIALPDIRDDFDQWDALSPERQQDVLVAAFSVSTVLDDVRLLRWAAERIKDVSRQCQFLVSQDVETDADSKEKLPSAAKVDPEETDVLEALHGVAHGLSAAALRLVEDPASNELFDEVAEHAAQVEDMRESAIQIAASSKVEALIAGFATFIDEKAKQASWLSGYVEETLAAWRATYGKDGGTSLDELSADIERARRELEIHLDAWEEAHTKEAKTKSALQDLHESTNDDQNAFSKNKDVEYKYYEEIAKFGRAGLEAKSEARKAALPATNENETLEPLTRPDAVEQEGVDDPVLSEPPEPSYVGEGESTLVAEATSPDSSAVGSIAEGVDQHDEARPQVDPLAPGESPSIPSAPIGQVDRGTWIALDKGRLGLAYHITRLSEEIDQTVMLPSSGLLATLALGSFLNGPEEEIVQEFGRRIGAVLSSLDFGNFDQETKDALNLLVFSASLRPALFAPQQTGAIAMLERVELSSAFTPVYGFAGAMASHADKLKSVQLDVCTLAAIFDAEVWQKGWGRHLERVAMWRSSAAPKFMFAPVDRVWRHWLGRGGVLAELTDLVSRDNATSVIRVREILDLLTNKPVRVLFEDTWCNSLGQRISRGVSGRALAQLERHLQEPVSIARDWLRIMEAKPCGTDWAKDALEELRRDIRNYARTALLALRRSQKSSSRLPLGAAIKRAIHAIESLANILLQEDGVDATVSRSAMEVLCGDLLHVPALRLDKHGHIEASVLPKDALALLVDLEEHVDSLTAAFDGRIVNDDLHGARAVCVRMFREGDPNVANCEQRLNEEIAARSRNLYQELYDLTEKLEQTFIMGEVSENEYAELNATIAAARQMLDQNDDDQTLVAIESVRGIGETVRKLFNACIEKTEKQLKAHRGRLSPSENDLVQDALNASDLIALHEYVDCLEARRPLVWTEADECKSLKAFLAVVDRMCKVQDRTKGLTQDAIISAAERREDILDLEFSALSASQAKRSVALINAWYLMARHRTANSDQLREFLALLGFAPKTAREDRAASGNVVVVKTDSLRNRELCPVHSFGSTAEGHYDVVHNWNSSAHGPIIQAVGSNPNRHIIVLHFGRIAREDRLWLKRWSIKNSNPFIVIDETLVLYLASLSSGTLRPLFDCTLPFTCVEPFFTAAGLMPPESFYGRESERRTIMDRYGSCFVYGGRQLGKTALLRSAEAAFHCAEKRHIAHCIDLKKYDIGSAHGADRLWNVLWDEFSKLGIITEDRRGRRGRDRLVRDLTQAMTDWLSKDGQSQILLLLDEADDFLKDDLKNNFRESRQEQFLVAVEGSG